MCLGATVDTAALYVRRTVVLLKRYAVSFMVFGTVYNITDCRLIKLQTVDDS